MKIKKLNFLFIITIFSVSINLKSQPEPRDLLDKMIQNVKQIKTLKYHAIMNERINGKMVLKDSYFKINVSPVKIYVSQSFIGIKLDALYVDGWNNNKLLVATVGFPWIKLSLDPTGNRVRDNHHHTIFEAGYNYFANVIEQIITNKNNEITMLYLGEVTLYGKTGYKIKISVKNYKIIPYMVKKDETLPEIAKKNLINDYKILELNPSIKSFNNDVAGQTIQIPNMYASSITLTLNKDTYLPIQIEIYDEKGIYAIYGYKDVIVNPTFEPDEFTPAYKNYHF